MSDLLPPPSQQSPGAPPQSSPSESLAPGWYPDAVTVGALRWWDGRQWTPYVSGAMADQPRREHPTLPFPVALGALLSLAVPLVLSRAIAGDLAELDWPVWTYLAISVLLGYVPSLTWCWYASQQWGLGDGFRADFGVTTRAADWGWGPLTWLSCFAAQVIVGIALLLTDAPVSSNTEGIRELRSDVAFRVAIVLVAVVIAPIVEEIVFRGAVLRSLLSVMPAPVAIGLQGVLFGVAHFRPDFGVGNIGLLVVLSAVGAVLGMSAYLLGRIVPAIAGHAILNGIAVGLALSGWSLDS